MKFLSHTGILVAFALSATTAFAVVPNFTCRPTAKPAAPTANPSQPTCDPKAADGSAHSANVVPASELPAQIADLKLSRQELRNLVLNARTRSEHLRLATYYSVRADDDLARVVHQQRMALTYRLSSYSKYAAGTVDQCVASMQRLKQHAAQMRRLQEEQEQLARDAGE